jgi:dihydropteroate synthase
MQFVGILNVTPDSYFAPSRAMEGAIERAWTLVREGANWIDVGGQSTRPARAYGPVADVSLEEELRRIEPVLEGLRDLPVPISIDTMKAEVAARAVALGARCVNDVSGLQDEAMVQLVADSGVYVCLCHCPIPVEQIHRLITYPEGVVEAVRSWLARRIDELLARGVSPSQIWIDPGFTFGKSIEDQWRLLGGLHRLKTLGFPLYVGISRKSFLGKLLQKSPEELLPATLGAARVAIEQGVDFLRVHDVQAHREILCANR